MKSRANQKVPQAQRVSGPTHIKDLVPDPVNRRSHNPRNLGMVVDALHAVGAARSIVIDENGVILAGNGVTEAAAEAGITKVRVVEADGNELIAVRRSGLTDEQKRHLAIADNRSAELATWNAAQFKEDLTGGLDFGKFFTKEELQAILGKAEPTGGLTDPDDVPQERPTGIVAGDLFELGRHRLLCGDCTVAGNVARLMGSARADLVFTSPPYGQQRDYGAVISDWQALMCGAFSSLPTKETAQVLVNLGLIHNDGEWIPYWNGWVEWMREHGWRRFGWYVWDQGFGMPGNHQGRLAPSHEFVFHFNRISSQANKWVKTQGRTDTAGGFRQKDGRVKCKGSLDAIGQPFKVPDSVIRVHREMSRGIHTDHHPAVFPVRLPTFIAETWSAESDIVFEPFSGSGSTLIACEQLIRSCYGIEIEPSYCQVIIDRWEAFTGQKAQKVGELVRA